ncbi:MAG: hypothetical protein Q7T76_05510 [Ferruginibacter sp.]|nr:hypothetical protein [Ferruginibacter sp.]
MSVNFIPTRYPGFPSLLHSNFSPVISAKEAGVVGNPSTSAR